MNRRSMKMLVAITILALLIILIYTGNNWIKVTHCHIETKNLPEAFDGFKIVHIGDLHGKKFGINNAKLARIINRQKPDLIFVTGDMISSQGDDGNAFICLLEELSGICPVYCSLGNHEQIVRDRDLNTGTEIFGNFKKHVQKAGGTLLDNQSVKIQRSGESIWVYGFTSGLYHYTGSNTAFWEGADLKADFIEEKLDRPDQDRFTILLAHNPKYFNEYETWGADIIFSGHIHGGVVRLPFLGGIFSPDITFFPEYDAGLYNLGEARMHVTRGLGNSVIPVRFLNRPEVTVATLKAKP
ncbi:MAG TPA: metallophosphoesterase [Firmicutes bacterium]|nr:metallophosphoesterase [Bacillota bacterium]